MNAPQRPQRARANRRRQPHARRPSAVDLWQMPPALPALEPISVPREAGALVRSLGDPPMSNGIAAGHYFLAVIERTAAVAAALALSADLLITVVDDDER